MPSFQLWTAFTILAISSVLTAGCAFRSPAAPDRAALRPSEFSESIWPARWQDDLPGLAERAPRALYGYVRQFEKDQSGEWHRGDPVRIDDEPFTQITHCQPRGYGMVQEYVPRYRSHADKPVRIRYLRFLSWCDEPDAELLRSDSWEDWRRYAAGMLLMPMDRVPTALVIVKGGGMSYDWELRWRMIERGWAVLHLGMASSVDQQPISKFVLADFGEVPSEPVLELAAEAKALEIHVGDIAATAAGVAASVDHYIADLAYAAEAFLAYAREREPSLRDLPIATVGLSMGAFAIPAMAARLDGDVNAAVLITGGADVVDIALRTSMTEQGWLRIEAINEGGESRSLTSAQRRALIDAYRETRNLDPYHMASALHGVPTLMLHGMFDRIVPASAGDRLYERLARPERWTYPLGHGGVFWLLPREADRIIDWIEAAFTALAHEQAHEHKSRAPADSRTGRLAGFTH